MGFRSEENNGNCREMMVPLVIFTGKNGTQSWVLKMKNIKLLTGDIWGHRTDIDKFAEIEI